MSVSNPPGYLFSQAYCSLFDLANGCELDARLYSKQTLSYDTSAGLNMRLTERFSPEVNDVTLCGTFTSADHGYKRMHVISLQYTEDDPATPIDDRDVELWLNVHHDCNLDGWKFYLTSRYTDANGNPHDFEPFTDRVINRNDWLDLTIEVRDNGQNTLLTAKNLSTGITYSKSITSWIGTRSLPAEIAIQYRHNERSRTDFVDFRLTQNDCGSLTDAGDSFNAAMSISPGTCDGSLKFGPDNQDWYRFYVSSTGTIYLTLVSSPGSDLLGLYDPNGVFIGSCLSCSWPASISGDYRVRVYTSGWSGTYRFSVSVGASTGGGGGSVMAGSLVTKADGSKVPIQNLVPGRLVQGYDRTNGQVVSVQILETRQVIVDNLVTIRLTDGTLIRTDNNPLQKFWVKTSDGVIGMAGVPDIRVGDHLFNVPLRLWVQVVGKDLIINGHYTMYDLITTAPDMGYVVEDILDP